MKSEECLAAFALINLGSSLRSRALPSVSFRWACLRMTLSCFCYPRTYKALRPSIYWYDSSRCPTFKLVTVCYEPACSSHESTSLLATPFRQQCHRSFFLTLAQIEGSSLHNFFPCRVSSGFFTVLSCTPVPRRQQLMEEDWKDEKVVCREDHANVTSSGGCKRESSLLIQ